MGVDLRSSESFARWVQRDLNLSMLRFAGSLLFACLLEAALWSTTLERKTVRQFSFCSLFARGIKIRVRYGDRSSSGKLCESKKCNERH